MAAAPEPSFAHNEETKTSRRETPFSNLFFTLTGQLNGICAKVRKDAQNKSKKKIAKLKEIICSQKKLIEELKEQRKKTDNVQDEELLKERDSLRQKVNELTEDFKEVVEAVEEMNHILDESCERLFACNKKLWTVEKQNDALKKKKEKKKQARKERKSKEKEELGTFTEMTRIATQRALDIAKEKEEKHRLVEEKKTVVSEISVEKYKEQLSPAHKKVKSTSTLLKNELSPLRKQVEGKTNLGKEGEVSFNFPLNPKELTSFVPLDEEDDEDEQIVPPTSPKLFVFAAAPDASSSPTGTIKKKKKRKLLVGPGDAKGMLHVGSPGGLS